MPAASTPASATRWGRRTGTRTALGGGPGALELNGGAVRSESTSENADIGLGSHAITDDSSHKVDGSIAVAPIVTAVRIATGPSGGRAYFRTGERIRVEVRFGKPVSANLPPRLALSIGATTRQVNAFTSSGHSEFLTFDYTVQADDYDADGFSIAAGALTLPAGGRVVDRGLRAANLNLGRHAISGAAGHRVNNAPPSFGSTTVANRTFALDAPVAPLVLPEATGEGTLSYTLTPSTMPQGMTWTPATRTIAGTPTAVTAARTYTWKATDSEDETATLTFTIAVAEIPIVSAVTFTSSPQSGDTYGVGERITVEVEWSESVTVTGSPRLALTVGSNTRYAEYAGGANPRFRYTVGTADRDTNGLSVAAGALELNGGAIRRGSTNENADIGLGGHAITDDSSHKVDGSIAVAPIVTAVRITTRPSGGRAYFRTGERIRVEVRFGKPVSANLPPRLALSIGATTRQVNAFASSGHSEFLTFDYTVQADDYDADGFSIAAGALTLPAGGRVLDRGARAANLNLGRHAISGAAGHRVNNAPPSFGSTTVANRTLALDAPIAPLVLPEATGEGILSYTLTPSTLPQGMTWTPATRTIAGTPTAVTAARTYTWKATDSEDETATLTFIIAVAEIPTITLTVDDNSVDEGDGATTITVTATVDGTTRFVEDKTIEVSVAGSGTATAVDFAAVTDFDVEIAAGAASQTGTFTLTPTDDALDEADETVTVSGSSSGLTVNPATISLTDNDASPTLSIDSPSVTEGDSGAKNLTFTVTLSAASGRQVTVAWADAGTGTTTSGTDYTAITGGTLTFAAGTTSRTFNVSVTGDTLDELDETVVVTLSGATNAAISTATGTGTITDNDGAPTLSIDSPSVTEGDSGAKNLTFTMTLSAASGRQVTVAYADAGTGAATSGTDYTALTAGTLAFAAGTTSQTFNVSVTGDTTDESNETVVVTLRNPTNAMISTGTGTGTITDNDAAPTLSIDSPSVTEGDSGAKNLTFTVTLSASSGKQVTVDWADAGTGTATGTGTDYTAITGGTLTFAAGTNSRTFNVSVTGDVLDESNETVVLTLSSATNATISTATGTGTITDDDSEPSLSIDSPSVMEGNSGSKNLTFTVTLSAASGRPVTVDYADAETGTATSGTDYTAITGGTLTFAAGTTSRTFNVSVTGDTTAESNETVVVTLRNPTNATVSSTAGTGTGTIAGDDTAGVTYNPTTLTVTEEGPSQSFTVVLNSQPPGTVWVGFTPESGILVADDTSPPYNITFNQVNWNTPKTVSVRALADSNSQDETRRIKVVVTQYPGANVPASANRTAVTVTVIDDDKPTVSLSLSRASIPENGGAATVTATLDEASTTATTITVAAGAGTAADSSDFTLSAAKTLTIAAGSTTSTGTVTITAVNDTRDEPDKRVTVSGSVSHNGVMRPSNRTLTITDDDPAPTLSIDSPSVTEGDSGATNLTFTATLSAASGRRVTVDWAGAGGTATSGTDYVAITGGTLAFAAGTTSRTFNVSVTGDVLDESNETVAVSLSNAANATVSSTAGTGTGTITDDDAEPSLSIDSPSVTEGDVGSRDLTFTVRLSAASGRQVTVDYADAGTGGATSGTDYTAITGGTLTFAAGAISRTFNVSVTGDVLDESNETVVVSLGNAANATVSTTAGTGTGTITDDDTAGVVKIPSFGSVAGPALHYQVHRSNISFSLPAAAGGVGAVTYALAATPALPGGLEYAPPAAGAAHGGIISGLPWRVAPRRTYTLTATDAVGNAAELAFTVVVNVAPGVTLAVANGSIPELGGSTMVTATLSHASNAATTITVAPVAGAYTVGADATIVIPAGDTANAADTASITAVNDTIDNVGDRAVTVRGSASNAQGVMAVTGAALTLTDNEATPTVTLFTNPEYVAEGGSAAVTARLNHASSETIRLTVSAAASVNTAAGDFTLSSARTLTIAAGSRNSTGAVTIATRRVTTDSLIRGVDIEATVSGASGVANPAGITLPVLDNDGAPTVTLSLSDSSVSEAGGTSTVTATLNRASSVATRITIASVSGFYTAGSDFHRTTPESTIVIAAGETANTADTATIVAVDNDTDSPNRSVQVRAQALYDGDIEDFNRIVGLIANRWKGRVRLPTSLVTGNVVYGLDVNGATLTLEDDDAPPWLMLVAADSSISENNGTTAVSATLNRPSSAATTVSMAVFGPSTTAPAGDYTLPADTTLTIAAGKTASADTVTVGAVDNPRDEPDRRLVLQAVNPQNSQGIGQFSGVPIAITDDDDAPTVRLALADSSIPENGGTTTVTAALSHPSSAATTVTVAGVPGFYTVGSDVTIVIPAQRRSNTADTVSITAVDDTIDDPGNRRTTVTGSASNTQGVGSVTGAALTLIDDDDAPTVTLALSEPDASKPDTVNESGAGNSSTVTATLDGRSSADVILTVAATAGANAVAGDFALSSAKTLTIAAGSTASTGTVTVTANDDTTDSPDKSVTVSATVSGTSGVAAPAPRTLTITDDDDAPAVTLAVVDSSVSENGGSTTVTAALSHPSSADTAITVTVAAGTGAVATDFTQTGATLTVAAGATRSTGTVTVTANDDTTDAPDKEVTISGSAINAQGVGAVTGTTLTITDDDAAPGVVLALADDSIAENGGSTTVTATLSHPSSAATTVTVTAVPGFYTVGADAIIVIAAGDTSNAADPVTIDAVNDAIDNVPDRAGTVAGAATNAQAAAESQTVAVTGAPLTLEDDEDTPTATLVLTPATIDESAPGNVSTVTATLNGRSSADVVLTVSATASTNAQAGDFVLSATPTLTIAAGATSSTGTVTVTATADTTDAPDKEVTISATVSGDSGVAAPDSETLTIEDDEAAPTVTLALADASIAENGGSTTVTATLSHPSSAATTVTVTAVSGLYTAGADATIVIAAGATANAADTATIEAVNDAIDNVPDRAGTVAGMAANAQAISESETMTVTGAALTITDDDTAGFSVSPSTSTTSRLRTTEDGGTAAFEVKLGSEPAGDVVLGVASSAPTEGTVSASSLTFTATTWNTAQTVTLTGVDDAPANPVDGDRSYTVTLTVNRGSTADPIYDTLSAITVYAVNADNEYGLDVGSVTGQATEAGGQAAFTVALLTRPSAAVTVSVSSRDASGNPDTSEGAASPSSLTFAATAWNTAQTVTVTGADDAIDDGEVTWNVRLDPSSGDANYDGLSNVDVSVTTTDDDDAPGVVLAVSPSSIVENGGVATVTATLTHPSSAATTVTVTPVPGFYTVGSDAVIVIAAGETANATDTATVAAVDNAKDEPDRTATVTATLTNSQGAGTVSGAALTVTDDDAAPGVRLAVADSAIAEDGGTTTVSAALTHPSSAATTVTVTPVPGFYTVGSDAVIVIAAGETANATDTATVAAVDNDTDALDRAGTVTVTVSNDRATADGTTLAVSGGALTVTDDDAAPNATLSLNPASVSENGGASAVSATLTHPSSEPTTVTVTPVSGAYTVGSDATIVIAAGSTSNATDTAAITAVDNATDEPDRTATVTATLANSQGAGTVTGATLTLTDDDDAPNAALSLNPASVSENGGASAVSATLTHPSSEPTTVTVTPVSGSYTVGSDAVIVIAAGSTANATDTAAVAAVDNAKDEPDRTATVTATLTNSQGAGTVTGATLTLTDDDAAPSLSIDSPRVDEGDSGTATLRFVVTLSAASGRQVTVGYGLDGTDGGTATAGTDYTAISAGTLTFTAGTTSRSIDVAVRGDTTDEADETIRVTLSGATNATGTPTGTGTITDDDDPPAVTLALADASIAENGGSTTVTATLSHPSSAATTVTVTGVSGLYTAGADATIVIAAGATANAADTATIEAVNDAIDNVPDRAGTVAGTAANAQATAESETMAVTGASLTITDDDTAGFAVSPSTSTTSRLRTTEDGGTAAFEVKLGSEPTGDVVLGVASSDTTEGTVSTSSLTFTATTWNTAQTVTLTGVDDAPANPADGDRSYTVTLTVNQPSTADTTYDALSAVTVYAVNADNEYGLDVGSVTGQATEAGGTATFTVALVTRPSAAVTVSVTSRDTSEGAASPSSLTFAATAWNVTQAVTVTGADDAIDDGEVTWNVRLDPSSGDANYDGLANVDVLVTTTDDDDAPGVVLAVSPSSIAENGGVSTVSATLTHPSSAATTVTVTPVSGFYTVGSDATIVIAAGSTANATDTATIAAVDNATDAPDRAGTVTATITNDRATTDGTTLAVSGGVLTVTDDDAAPNAALSLNPVSVSENGGASAVSATLTHPSSEPTTVTVTPVSGSYTVGSDATIVIAAGSTANATDTVAIAAVDNMKDEPDRTATVTATLTNSQGAGTVSGAALTLTDDDAAPTVRLAVADSAIAEDGGSTTVSATLTHPSSAATTVTVTPVSGFYTVGSDAVIVIAAGLTTNATDTATVAAVNDAIDNVGNRSATVTGTAANAQATAESETMAVTGAALTLTDDEATPEATLVLSPATIDEFDGTNVGASTVTATLNRASSEAVTLTVAATAVAPASASDFSLSSAKTLTIAAGSTASTGAVTVTAVDDTTDAPDKEVTVSAAVSGDSGVAAPDSETLTIEDDEAAPGVRLAVADSAIAEDGGTTTVSAALTHPSSAATTVTVTPVSGFYTVGSDAVIVIAAGSTANATDTATVAAVDNDTDALDRAGTVTVTVSNDRATADGTTLAVSGGALTVTDDDAAPNATLSLNPASVSENGGASAVSATLTHPSSEPTTVTVTPVSGAYTVGSDATIVIAAGETANATDTAAITAVDNTKDEPDRTATVTATLANSQGAGTVTGATLTLEDDDAAPGVTLALSPSSISESGGVSTVTATLSRASSAATTVTVTPVSGFYTVGSDATIVIAAGSTANATDTATVTAVNDAIDNVGNRSATVTGTAENAQATAESETMAVTGAALTLTDDEATPEATLVLSPATIDEFDGTNVGASTVTATLNRASSEAVTLTVAATAVAPASASDFSLSSAKTLTIAAEATSSTGAVTVKAVDNTTDAPDKEVTVSAAVSGDSGVAAPDSETLTLEDDDAAPGVVLGLSPSSISESGGVSTVTAALTHPSSAATTVTVTPVSGFYTVGSDAVIVIAAGSTANATDTATVAAVDNATDALDRAGTVTATITNDRATADGTTLAVSGGALTVTDDDAAPNAALSLNPSSVSENGGASTVSATLTHPSSEPTTVTVTPVSGFYTVGSDAVIVIAAGSTANATDTATVVAVDNATDEPDRTATVTATLANSQGAGTVSGAALTLEDDDAAPGVTLALSPSSISESGGVSTVTATLSRASSAATTVTVTPVSGFYTVGSDAVIVIAAGSTANATDTATVAAVDNTTDAPDRAGTVTVTVSNDRATADGTTPAVSGGALTVTDDDDAPNATLSLNPASVSENGGASAVSATLTHPSSAATTVTVTPVSGAYTVGSDATIVIAAGSTANATDTAAIAGVDNAKDEPDRTATVTATLTNSQGAGTVSGATLTLADDDTAGFSVSPAPSASSRLRTTEDGGTDTFTVKLGSEPTGDVVLAVASSDTAEGTVSTSSLTFTVTTWSTAQTVTLTGVDDAPANPADGDRNYTVTLTVNRGSTADAIYNALSAVTVYAVNADNEYGLDVSPVTGQATEAGGTAAFTVALNTRPSAAVTVSVTSRDASEGAASPSSLTFETSDWDTAQAVTVTGADDAIDDGDVTWAVRLDPSSGDANYSGLSNVDVSVTTTDDDDAPGVTLSLSPSSISESGGVSTVTATLSRASSAATTVTVTPVSGFYTVGSDATIVIAAGETANTADTATVAAVDNDTDAPDRAGTVTATITNARATADGTTLAVSGGALTVTDDDAAPNAALSLNPSSVSENGGASTVSATLTHPSSAATTVTVTPVSGFYTVGSDAVIVIAAGETANATDTATVAAVDNATDEPDRTATVTATLANSQGAGTVTGAALTITDDDGEPSLSIDSPSVAEGDSGSANLVFTVSLGAASGRQVTVGYADAGTGTAAAGTDYTAISAGTLTFAAGETAKTLTVTVTGDTTSEPDETVVVSLSGSVNAVIGTASGTGTITDDDATPTVTLALSEPDASKPDTVNESGAGNSSTVTATLGGRSSAEVILTVAATAGANAEAGDFALSSAKTLTIAAGATASAGTVTVTAVDDTKDAPDKEVTVSAVVSGSSGVAAPSAVTLTITDDDAAPLLSIDSPSVAEGDSGSANLVFTVTLSAASGRQVTVGYADAGTGTATSGTDYTALASGTLTFAAGETSKTLTVTVTGDGTDEANETVVVALSGAVNAALGTASGTGTITDVEDLTPEFTEAVSDQLYWVGTAIDALKLPAASGGDGALAYALLPQLPEGLAFDADTRMVTGTPVEVVAETVYTLTATDADGDAAMLSFRVEVAMPVVMSMEDAQAEEGEAVAFMVELSPPPPRPMEVLCMTAPGTATAHDDYVHMEEHRLSIAAGQHSVRVAVATIDDEKVEPEETFTVRLVPEWTVVERVEATGTILDNDAAAARARALKMVLASFGREVAQEAVEVVGERLGDVASGSHVTLAGQRVPLGSAAVGERDGEEALPGGFDREASHRREVDKRRSVSVREIVSDSAFALSFGVPEEAGSGARDRWMVWGRTGWSEFSGRPQGELSAQGKVFSGYVGFDARVRDDLVLGMALSHSEGDMSYERSGAGGTVDARLTSVLPYGRWTAGGGLSVWGLAGAGWGEVELVDDLGATRTGMGMELLALGWRQELGAWQEVEWALKGDGFVVEMDSEAAWMLPATKAGAQRLRLMLESGMEWPVAERGRLRTQVEFGGRWDGGDAQRGYGSEVGGSLEYVDSRTGVGIEGRGRYVLGHESQGFREWGASLGVRVDPGGDGEGVWIGLSPVWGAPHSGVQSLWGSGPEGGGSKESSSVRMALEAGYRSGDALDVSVTVDRERRRQGGASSPVGMTFRTRLRW